jgi:hypothetical protein
MIAACFVFAYSFSKIGQIVEGKLEKKKKLFLIINFAKK